MIEIISPMIKQFLPFAQKRMGFSYPPKLFLRGDNKNAKNPLGRTAYYDPEQKSITVYTTGRHPKDVMRSISHELVHHAQNCRGEFDKPHQMGDGYAQNDSHMREMEREAYEVGNMCFRDWEDGLKNTIYLEHLQKGDKKMSTKDWKNKEIGTLLSEAWGFKFNSLEEFNEFNGEGELQAEAEHDDEIDEGRGRGKKKKMEEADEDLDERLSFAKGKSNPGYADAPDNSPLGQKRKEDEEEERKKRMDTYYAMTQGTKDEPMSMKEEDELEELAASSGRQSPHADRRGDDERKRPMEEKEDKDKKAKKGKYDDGDGKDEKCDHVPCEDQDKKDRKPTKEQIEALVKKALQEVLQKRKG